MKVEELKKDFPLLKNSEISYLDSRSNYSKTSTSYKCYK